MSRLVVGTAGHIDHGKSTLVHALTGIDPDRLKEEKARGITIELGFAHVALAEVTCAFVDVPGHERFVRTMLAGVGGIDFVMLVVASDEGVMPQTREHFDICRLLGVPDGVVVLTKADAADGDTREIVRLEVADLVKGSFLEQAPVIEVSARTGAGLDALRATLVDAAARARHRPEDGVTRVPVDRVFSMRGFGTVVTGTLVSGRVHVGDEMELLPSARRVKVRGVQVHGRPQDEAVAGQRVALNLGGLDVADGGRGETLAAPGALAVTRRADVSLELLPGARALRHGARVRVHQGTAEILARVSLAGAEASEVAPGARALARLRLEAPGVLTRGDRLILRAYSPPMTIGAASVLDPAPRAAGIRTAAAVARLARLNGADGGASLTAMIEEAGLAGLPAVDATVRVGLSAAEARAAIDRILAGAQVVRAGDRLVSTEAMTRAATALTTLVGDAHRAQPLSEGVPREEARARLFARVDTAVFESVVSDLARRGKLVDRERLALPGHQVVLVGEEAAALGIVEDAYRAGGLTPPDSAALPISLGLSAGAVQSVTTLLLRQKALVKMGTLLVHKDALDRLKKDMGALKAAAAQGPLRIDVAWFKDRYGVSRKFAIPLLEYLDRERITRRIGDLRVVL